MGIEMKLLIRPTGTKEQQNGEDDQLGIVQETERNKW